MLNIIYNELGDRNIILLDIKFANYRISYYVYACKIFVEKTNPHKTTVIYDQKQDECFIPLEFLKFYSIKNNEYNVLNELTTIIGDLYKFLKDSNCNMDQIAQEKILRTGTFYRMNSGKHNYKH